MLSHVICVMCVGTTCRRHVQASHAAANFQRMRKRLFLFVNEYAHCNTAANSNHYHSKTLRTKQECIYTVQIRESRADAVR